MIEAIVKGLLLGNGQISGSTATAGLVDANGVCINAILVHLDDAGEVDGYAPPEGVTLHIHESAGIGRVWNGSEFVEPNSP